MSAPLNNVYPEMYNADGEKMELYFMRDVHGAHIVYSGSKYFEFDWYNFGLDTHFYTHNSMLEVMGKPKRKYGMLVEAEIIVPDDYTIFEKHKGLEQDFDLIFTFSDAILQSIPNARYVPYYIKAWYPHNSLAYQHKTKNISIIASGKTMVPLHNFRNARARQCKTRQLADIYGTIDGGRYCEIHEPFTDYRFSIVIENETTPLCFTKK